MDKRQAVVLLAFLLGFGGLVFVFSDLGPGEGWPFRVAITAAYFFISGAFIGYAQPKTWAIALLVAWGGVLMGGFITLVAIVHYGREAFAATQPPFITSGLIILFGSVGATLLGAFFGKLLPRKDIHLPHG